MSRESTLEAWERERCPILDTRLYSRYLTHRLHGSVSIPLNELMDQGRMFELPPPTDRFAVLLPSLEDTTVVLTEKEAVNDPKAVYLKGESCLEDFLFTRGWTKVACYLRDGPELWEEAERMGLIEEGTSPPYEEISLRRRYLFRPCPLLETWIAAIEQTMASACSSAAEKEGERSLRLRMLEPGCGSGRNLAWVASRQTKISNVSIRWEVMGLDSWWGALERCQALAVTSGYPPSQYKLLHSEVDQSSGLFIQPAGKKKASSSSSHIMDSIKDVGSFDLILFARFLHRPLHDRLPCLLKPGGYMLYNSFIDMPGTKLFGRPCGRDHLLDEGELAATFGPPQFEIVHDGFEVESLDGREMSLFVARKYS